MKKVGVVLVVLAAIAALGLPPVLGMLTQSQVDSRVTALANNPVLTARIVSYERGWFSSVARIELGVANAYPAQLDAFGGDPLPRTLLLLVDLAHGPIAVRDGVHFGLSQMVARPDPEVPAYAALLQRLSVPYLFEFRGRTDYSGTLRFDADAPPVSVAAGSGTLTFSGAALGGAVRGRSLQYHGRIDSLELDSGPGAVRLQRLTATGDNELRASLPLGPAQLAIERVSMSDAAVAGGPVLDAANVRIHSNFALDASGALVNGTQTFTVDSIDAPPEVAIRAATIEVVYGNLDADALETYTETLQRSVATGAVDPNLVLADITPSIERLLAAEPSFGVDPLQFTFNDQSFDARLKVTTRAAALPPAGALDLRDPGLWLDVLEVTAEATIAKELARDFATRFMSAQFATVDPALPPDQIRYMAEAQVGLVLVTLLSQGFLVEQGEAYTTSVSFGGGVLTVNGMPLPLGP